MVEGESRYAWMIRSAAFLLKYVILFIFALCLFLILIASVSAAEVISIELPGQKVYLGDTINVQNVLSWGDMLAFAWYDDGYYDETPDHIYEVKGDQHKWYLDPLTFKTGIYYKWSGKYEPHSYPVAFEILPGRRPEAIPTASDRATPQPTPTPIPEPEHPKNTHIFLARGDDAVFKYYTSADELEGQKGYLWLFPTKYNTKSVMGSAMEPIEANVTGYQYRFEPILTEQLSEAWYTGFMQFTGENGYQDVFYDYRTNSLDTPYDDAIIPDVNLDPFIPIRVQQEFEKLERPSEYCDDVLIPITMEVREPFIVLNEYYENEDSIFVEGNTSLSEGTNITFMVDPIRWALEKDVKAHTWTSQAIGGIKDQRTFLIEMKLNWDEMAIGWHTVKAWINKNKTRISGEIQFQVSDVYIMPTPTPIYERVVVEQYGTHRLNSTNHTALLLANVTTVPTPEPTTIPTTIITTVQITTTAPTPTPVPTPKPTPTIKVPVQITTVLIAVGLGLWGCKFGR